MHGEEENIVLLGLMPPPLTTIFIQERKSQALVVHHIGCVTSRDLPQ